MKGIWHEDRLHPAATYCASHQAPLGVRQITGIARPATIGSQSMFPLPRSELSESAQTDESHLTTDSSAPTSFGTSLKSMRDRYFLTKEPPNE